MDKQELIQNIQRLKAEKDALIVAHYYVDGDVQAIADYVGDSYYLSKVCMDNPQKVIVFCGVKFMGESAKIMNPEKTIMMAAPAADCPMAHMADVDKIENMRKQYDDLAVVCYINSTAEIKAHSDVIVTSSNALNIVSKLTNKNIFFIPDEHLGRYIAEKLPEKNFIFNDGYCHVHTSIHAEDVIKAKEARPNAEILVHPECPTEIVELANYVGSTSGILDYATKSDSQEFIICTEIGIFYELEQKNPNKKFYSVGRRQFCPNMKLISLENVLSALENIDEGVQVDENIARKAKHALSRMHELGN